MASRTAARERPLVRLVLPFLLLVALGATWSVGMPFGAAPDEPSHARRAAGVARGQLAKGSSDEARFGAVEVPVVLDYRYDCFAHDPAVDASCMHVPTSKGDRRVLHSATGYPPLYHFLSGIPTVIFRGAPSLYLQRLGIVAVGAALIVAGASRLRSVRSQAAPLIGLALTLSPMTLFILGTVNPSGLAIAAAVGAWCWGIHLTRLAQGSAVRTAAIGLGTSLSVLLLVRRDSVLWAALIVAALLAITPSSRWALLVRSRAVQLMGLVTAAAGAIGLAFSRSSAEGIAAQAGEQDVAISLGWAYDELARTYREMVGVLGWLDTEIPVAAQVAFGLVLVSLVGAAVVRAPRRVAVTTVAVVAALVVAILVVGAARPGYAQGRYFLPVAVGVPLLAGFGLGEAGVRVRREVLAVALALLVAVQVAAFHAALRRFSVGIDGPRWFLGDPTWEPPGGVLLLLAANAVIAAALATVGFAAVGRSRRLDVGN